MVIIQPYNVNNIQCFELYTKKVYVPTLPRSISKLSAESQVCINFCNFEQQLPNFTQKQFLVQSNSQKLENGKYATPEVRNENPQIFLFLNFVLILCKLFSKILTL